MMDSVKVAKDYFLSSQSGLLIPNREYGTRKLIQITGLPKPPAALAKASAGIRSRVTIPRRRSDSNLLDQQLQKANNTNADSSSSISNIANSSSSSNRILVTGDIQQNPSTSVMRSNNKQWIHPPDSLLKGHILYHVKFLGECSVDQPKGTEVVKEAIRKMKFNKHIKRAEGQKPPKVDLTISADGVTIQDPKSKMTLHEYPLHRISYCADDKSDKKMFTFIAKAATTNDHFCYVFDSDKCAEEITLTVGQAFDLAYKRFLESGVAPGSDGDFKKQCLVLNRKVQSLQFENDALKKRIAELETLKDRSDLEEYMKNNQLTSLTSITLSLRDASADDDNDQSSTDDFEPPSKHKATVGRRLENLIFDSDTHTNGHSSDPQSPTPLLSPPPPTTRHHRNMGGVPQGQPVRQNSEPTPVNPFTPVLANDPFGMGAFNPDSKVSVNPFGGPSQQELMDIQAGFSRGLSFGTDDFNLDDLDPLNQRL